MNLRAFGGGELTGEKLVRYAFFDEAGVGSMKDDPNATVVGAIVHCDTQLKPLETFLADLRQIYIPASHRDGFIFHATEMFSRKGPVFGDTSLISDDQIKKIIEAFMSIPERFGLPLVVDSTPKEHAAKAMGLENSSVADKTLHAHGSAFFACVFTVERWMREHAPSEYCQLVIENNDHARKTFDRTNKLLCDDRAEELLGASKIDVVGKYLPMRHIRKTPLFEEKSADSVLTLVDFCAYVFSKHAKALENPKMGEHPIFTPLAERLVQNVFLPWVE